MKVKRFEEVNYIATKKSLKKELKIMTGLFIAMTIIASIISLACFKLGIENETLMQENEELRKVIEIKDSMISDLQEDNMKLQEMIR